MLLEAGVCSAVLLVATFVLVRFAQRGWSRWVLAGGLAYAGLVLVLIEVSQASEEIQPAAALVQRRTEEYVSSAACRSCHPGEHASWKRTYHHTMTQQPSTASMRAPWQGKLVIKQRTYELVRRDGAHFVMMPLSADESGRVERQVKMITGSHHYQVFWISGDRGNELFALPFVYHLATGRFIPRDDAFLQPPEAHGRRVRFNSNCIQCHVVAGRPQHQLSEDVFRSEAVELGIGCESCHGPGGKHVRHYQNPLVRYVAQGDAEHIVNPAKLDAETSSSICGQCHAYFVPLRPGEWWRAGFADSYQPGDRLAATRRILRYDNRKRDAALVDASFESIFWPDGSIRVGGREYNGLLESPCYEQGHGEDKLGCLSCHSMHDSEPNDQLAEGMLGNSACTQCHSQYGTPQREREHTHHEPGTSGSQCYGCHMPKTTYALFKGIRSHRIDSPSAAKSWKSGQPNACNLCHIDRTLSWASEKLSTWYGESLGLPPGAPLDAQANGQNHDDVPVAASVRGLIAGNAAERAIWAFAYGTPAAHVAAGSDWQAPLLAELLNDPYAAVRWIAWQSLRSLPGYADFEFDYVAPVQERQLRQQAVWARWQAGQQSTTSNRLPRLLLDASGVDAVRLEALRAERDEQPITISE